MSVMLTSGTAIAARLRSVGRGIDLESEMPEDLSRHIHELLSFGVNAT